MRTCSAGPRARDRALIASPTAGAEPEAESNVAESQNKLLRAILTEYSNRP